MEDSPLRMLWKYGGTFLVLCIIFRLILHKHQISCKIMVLGLKKRFQIRILQIINKLG